MNGEEPHIEIQGLNVWYNDEQALRNITAEIPKHKITAVIGPSGCGKTTLLKCLNRLHEEVDGIRVAGAILILESQQGRRSLFRLLQEEC